MTIETKLQKIVDATSEILTLLGEDTIKRVCLKTLMRVAKALELLAGGYNDTPTRYLNEALFTSSNYEMALYLGIVLRGF